MLDHVSFGVRNIGRSKSFYDAVLGGLGYRCLYETAESLGYGADSVTLWISATDHPVGPDMRTGFISAFPRRAERASMLFMRTRWRRAGAPTGRREYEKVMGRITMPRSSSIPTDIGSKPIAAESNGTAAPMDLSGIFGRSS